MRWRVGLACVLVAFAALPTGFVAAFAQGRPRAIHGGTDLFFAHIAAR